MSAKKMLVITLAKTHAVLAAVTRGASGPPKVEDLVGEGLLVRMTDREETVSIPAADLEVKEVEYVDDVFQDPLARAIDASGTIVVPTHGMATTGVALPSITVAVNAPNVSSDKAVMVVVDASPGRDVLKRSGTILAGTVSTTLTTNDVPSGTHLVFASVEGEGSLVVKT